MMLRRLWLVGGLALGLLLAAGLWARPAAAQDATPPGPVTDDQVNQVAKRLYCPVCESIPLDVCPTQACIQWRNTIREKLEAGWSEQQILDYFVAQYGERVLGRPSTRGLNVLVWVMPPVLIALGAFFLWRYLAQTAHQPAPRAQSAPSSPAAPAATDEYAQRLEQELKKRI